MTMEQLLDMSVEEYYNAHLAVKRMLELSQPRDNKVKKLKV